VTDQRPRPGLPYAAGETDLDQLARLSDEVAHLRGENDDLRRRVGRLEARSGRGIIHPSEF
jgi:hypothetical protein